MADLSTFCDFQRVEYRQVVLPDDLDITEKDLHDEIPNDIGSCIAQRNHAAGRMRPEQFQQQWK